MRWELLEEGNSRHVRPRQGRRSGSFGVRTRFMDMAALPELPHTQHRSIHAYDALQRHERHTARSLLPPFT